MRKQSFIYDSRALDIKARAGKKLEAAPRHIMDEVLARLAPLFE